MAPGWFSSLPNNLVLAWVMMSTQTSFHVLAKLQKIAGGGAMKPLEEVDMDN